MKKERQIELAQAAILAAAEAASKQGVPTETFFSELVEVAMQAIASATGGVSGLAEWHREEAESLRERLKAIPGKYN